MSNVSGNIFQIQRWSLNDGEGIRSTVFLKGCPLRCQWCANPESWHRRPQVLFFRERCRGCGRCVQVCSAGASAMENGSNRLAREKCTNCGQCCAVCPTGARKKMGSTMTVEEVLKVLKRDAIFYRESGGGVSFSGGEPFGQPEFLRELVISSNRLGLDTAVETCAYFDWDWVKDIIELLDCVFVDIKHMDDRVHQEMTGVSNRRILENIALISQLNPRTIVRVPLIEEVNAGEQNIRNMCEFLQQNTRVKRVEILPYHDFGEAKYKAVGVESRTFTTPNPVKIEEVKKIIFGYGINIIDYK